MKQRTCSILRESDLSLPYARSANKSLLSLAVLAVSALILVFGSPLYAQNDPPLDLTTTVPGHLETSWIGNTVGAGASGKMIQYGMAGLYVSPDGTCYANNYSVDATRMWGVYKDGQSLGFIPGFGAWMTGGCCIEGDDQYLYIAKTLKNNNKSMPSGTESEYPPIRGVWYGISRIDRSSWKPVPMNATGHGYNHTLLVFGTKTDKNEGEVTGEALDGSSHTLYASDNLARNIDVIDTSTMAITGKWQLADDDTPMGLTWDQTDHLLWAIVKTADKSEVWAYNSKGQRQQQLTLTFDDAVVPGVIKAWGGKLYVADDGIAEDIKVYNHLASKPALSGTLGVQGGIFGGPPESKGTVGPWRFDDISGLGFDSKGNLYVSENGNGATLASYDLASRKRNWLVEDHEYVDIAQIDPDHPETALGSTTEYSLDYSTTTPGKEFKSVATTFDPLKYPTDRRLVPGNYTLSQAFDIQGHRFLAIGGAMFTINFYRFDPSTEGHIAIPCGYLAINGDRIGHAEYGSELWTDSNGDGKVQPDEISIKDPPIGYLWTYHFDSAGTLWISDTRRILEMPATLDANGSPVYSWSRMTVIDPGSLGLSDSPTKVERLFYDHATDTMYWIAFTKGFPAPQGWSGYGDTLCCVKNWSTRPSLQWEMSLPCVEGENVKQPLTPEAMAVAGDYVFVQYCQRFFCRVYNAHTGEYVGTIIPDPNVVGDEHTIWVDLEHGISAVKRPNGEYDITVEDDIWTKTILYRWKP